MPSQNSLWNKITHSLRALFRRDKVETELDSELRFHLEAQIESNIRVGMSRDAARQSALREFGGVELAKEECRDERGTQFLEQLWQDVRFGARMLRKNPGFTAVAVLTLALGIGANTAIFSLIDTVLLHPLPVPHPNQLFLVQWKSDREPLQDQVRVGVCDEDNNVRESTGCGFSYATFEAIRESATSVAAVTAANSGEKVHMSLGGGTEHTPAIVDYTSGNFFDVLQVPAFLGRTFVLEDDRLGASPVAVVSYNLWRERFGSDPNALGRLIYVEDAAFTVVGVAPRNFPGLSQIHPADLWIPIHAITQIKRESSTWTSPDSPRPFLAIIARLKPDVIRAAAQLALTSLYRAALANDPQHPFAVGAPPEITLADFSRGSPSYIRELFSQPLAILMVIVSCVLLIACANIASLNLARASARRTEIAVRFALGAGRGRLLRQLFTESLLLAIGGAIAGSLLAVGLTRFLAAFVADGLSVQSLLGVKTSPLVFAYTAGIATVSALFFGLLPAVTSSRVDPAAVMRASGAAAGGASANSTSSSGKKHPLPRVLVTAQVSVALMLLVGAGLFLRTLRNLEFVNTGFDKPHVLVFNSSLLSNSDAEGPRISALNNELRAQLSALPGVLSVSWMSVPFLGNGTGTNVIAVLKNGHLETRGVDWQMVGPDLFKTLDIPIVAGRDVEPADLRKDSGVVWINHNLAQHIFPDENAVGKPLRLRKWCTVAGVVGDTKYNSVRDDMPETIYEPLPNIWPASHIMIRTAGDPAALAATVRDVVRQNAPYATVYSVKTESQMLDKSLFYERLMARLSLGFGLLALLLTCIGVYGVLAFATARRTGEIAIRISLGAMPWDILRLILNDGLRPAIAGTLIGLLGCFALTRLLTKILYGIKPFDPVSFCGATLILLVVAAIACYIPARRATRVDPMTALRNE